MCSTSSVMEHHADLLHFSALFEHAHSAVYLEAKCVLFCEKTHFYMFIGQIALCRISTAKIYLSKVRGWRTKFLDTFGLPKVWDTGELLSALDAIQVCTECFQLFLSKYSFRPYTQHSHCSKLLLITLGSGRCCACYPEINDKSFDEMK